MQLFPVRPAQNHVLMLLCSLQEGDHRWINSVARALQLLNSLYGPFSRVYGIGRCAKVGMAGLMLCYHLWSEGWWECPISCA